MPLPPARILLAALAAALALMVAGCGDEKKGGPIPTAQATELNRLLDETQRRIAARACGDVKSQDLPRLESIVNRLPGSVDHNTRTSLNDGVAHLRTLVNRECGQIQAEKTKTQTTPTETTPTETQPTTTETTPTETQPTATETTPTQPPTDTSGGGVTVPENNGGGAKPGKGPKDED